MQRRRALGIDADTRRTRDRTHATQRAAAGLCRCGRQPRPGRRRCETCAAHYSRRRKRALADGLCRRCLKAAAPNRATCTRCRGKYETRKTSRKIGRHRSREYATWRRRTQARLDKGQCPRCTAPLDAGCALCKGCLADRQLARRERKAHWEAGGLCVRCGRGRDKPNVIWCSRCLGYKSRYTARNRAGGLCSCGNFRVAGKKACARCLTYSALATAAARRRAAQSDAVPRK